MASDNGGSDEKNDIFVASLDTLYEAVFNIVLIEFNCPPIVRWLTLIVFRGQSGVNRKPITIGFD